ncbi:hypothetical protein Bbelb_065590 [Branchiostoma belcheri]|nr:hypothetical protein Bbelb_065590 [Branchiostoma belcheri]
MVQIRITSDSGVLAALVKRIPALESRVNTLERMFKKSQERWETLEATLNTNNESSEVREMVNSIVLRMESLENMTVGAAQQRVDVRENATCGTCAATSITAELMAQIINTVRNQSGESSGQQDLSNTSSNCADIVERSGFNNQNFYTIDLDGPGRGVEPMEVQCDLEGQTAITLIGHDSEARTHVNGFENPGSYSKDVTYWNSMEQVRALVDRSSRCKQFIKYQCYGSTMWVTSGMAYAWWMTWDGRQADYWGGASPGSGKCACGETVAYERIGRTRPIRKTIRRSVTGPLGMLKTTLRNGQVCAYAVRMLTFTKRACSGRCYCDINDHIWRVDSGYLTHRNDLPVTQLRFGDTGGWNEEGYHTLGKLICYP